jgi:protein O-mannosyl-transferase
MPEHKQSSRPRAPRDQFAENVAVIPALWGLAAAAALALAVFVAYLPSIGGGFIWDDELLVTKNTLVMASGNPYRIWCTTDPIDYWPMTNTAFWLEWRLWEMHPAGYHVTNLVLHIAGSLLIWAILRRLSIPGAFFAALIFALHPVNVESVAWIAQRKNTLSMLFFLLAMLWYLKTEISAATAKPAATDPHSTTLKPAKPAAHYLRSADRFSLWYLPSFSAFALAMLSKGSVVVLPFLLLGIIWWLRPLKWRDVVRIAPFVAFGAVMTYVNVWFQKSDVGETIRNAGMLERLLGAGGIVWFYLYKAILPLNLIFIYPQWNVQADSLVWWLPLLSAVVVTVVLWLYRRTWGRPLLFAWGFFCVALLPVMGLVDVYFMKYSLVADHYEYIALAGVVALATAGWRTWQKLSKGHMLWSANVTPVVVALALASLTWRQSASFQNAMTLYQTTLEKNPDCWMAHNNLGLILADMGREQDAVEHYRKSISLNPGNAEAYNNLGLMLSNEGRLPEAIEEYGKALHYKHDFAEAHNNLGGALLKAGRVSDAIQQCERALALKPAYPEALNNLGEAMFQTGRYEEAAKRYRQALDLRPDLSETHYNLGVLLLETGRTAEAVDHLQLSLKLRPDFPLAHNNLGTALLRAGRIEEAIGHYKQALKLKPDYISACANLASACTQANRTDEAITYAKTGLNLAREQGQTEQAKQFEDFLKSLRK